MSPAVHGSDNALATLSNVVESGSRRRHDAKGSTPEGASYGRSCLIAVQKVLTGGLRAAAFVRLHGSRSGSGRGGGRERQRTGAATGCADLDVGACGGGSNWV